MTNHPYYILDVFAETKYAGNQLAVFREAASISSAEMQQIAREINFSETTFILSDQPRAGGYDVRIFTPREEVPFAGHPTIGTAHVIYNEVLHRKADKVVLNLKAGAIPVTFSQDGDSAPAGYAWMKQIQPTFGAQHEPQTLAAVLGLDAADIDERFPIQEVSTGLPFFITPLKTISALKRAKIDLEKYYALIDQAWAKGILIFCPETHMPGNDLSVRVFVDYYGVPEDPATGSANGCLAGYLAQQRYWGEGLISLRVEQGYEIGRPSLLLLNAAQNEAGIDIYIGGKTILVAQGDWI